MKLIKMLKNEGVNESSLKLFCELYNIEFKSLKAIIDGRHKPYNVDSSFKPAFINVANFLGVEPLQLLDCFQLTEYKTLCKLDKKYLRTAQEFKTELDPLGAKLEHLGLKYDSYKKISC